MFHARFTQPPLSPADRLDPMRFATWNVNSIRTRVDRVIAFLQRSDTDVLAMPRKLSAAPTSSLRKHLRRPATTSPSTVSTSGTASPSPPVCRLDVQDHFPTQPAFGEPPVVEARALGVTIDTTDALPSEDGQASSMTIWSLYVPNGRELTHAHYAYKLEWLANLAEQGRRLARRPERPHRPRRRLERRSPR